MLGVTDSEGHPAVSFFIEPPGYLKGLREVPLRKGLPGGILGLNECYSGFEPLSFRGDCDFAVRCSVSVVLCVLGGLWLDESRPCSSFLA